MNSNQIKLNSKDINKIPPELIYNITLKNGYILIIDDSISSKNIYDIFNYNYNKINNSQYKSKLTNKSININTNNSFKKDINGKTLDMNDSYLFNQNIYKSSNYSNNFFYTSNPNNSINNNDMVKTENKAKTKDVKYHNQSISDLVTEKLQKRFHSNSKIDNSRFKTTINSEINLNIKGNETKKKYENNLLKDFDELLLNFNDKKKGLNILNISNNSKKKYKFYKKFNTKKNEKLLLDDLSGISSVTKAIKYIRRNEQNNTIINTEFNRNNLGINRNNSNKLSYLKAKTLKRNKSNNFYLVKNNKIINDIVSPPNNLLYSKVLFMQNK